MPGTSQQQEAAEALEYLLAGSVIPKDGHN
jgi:hypothetical protein